MTLKQKLKQKEGKSCGSLIKTLKDFYAYIANVLNFALVNDELYIKWTHLSWLLKDCKNFNKIIVSVKLKCTYHFSNNTSQLKASTMNDLLFNLNLDQCF